LYYEYARFDEEALYENRIKVENNQYHDNYINGAWQNPYETLQTVAYALPVKNFRGMKFDVILPEDLLLSNSREDITKIEVDFGDGSGYRELTAGQRLPVEYTEEGVYKWQFRTTIRNSQALYSGTVMGVTDYRNPHQQNVFIPGPGPFGNTLPKLGAILRIDYASGHNGQIKRPFIIAEGFDPGSILTPENAGGDRTLN